MQKYMKKTIFHSLESIFTNLKYKNMRKIIWGIIIAIVAISACKKIEDKKEEPTIKDVTTCTKDDNLVQSIFDDANSEADMKHASTQEGVLQSEDETGPVVTVDTGENGYRDSTWTITIDYGDGITGRYGWVRKGKIHIAVHGFYKMEGSTRTMTFENYYVNDNKIEGTHHETNQGFDEEKQAYIIAVSVTGGKLTKPDNSVITWESERTRNWLAGYDTPLNIYDDEYSITGEAHGINSDGASYSKNITEALLVSLGCEYIQDGIVEYYIDEQKVADIDFGYEQTETDCDNQVQIIYKSQPFVITL